MTVSAPLPAARLPQHRLPTDAELAERGLRCAALVEEALAAAQSLSQQAVALSQTVGQFRVS